MRISLPIVLASFVLAISAPALAQDDAAKERALALYDEATKKYNVGEWDAAIKLYKDAYGAYPAPEFLFNIGQAYRQKNDCKNGLFFYKRYLANKPDAENRDQVEGFITDLEAMCKNQDQVRDKQPSNPVPPDGGQGSGSGTGTGGQTGGQEVSGGGSTVTSNRPAETAGGGATTGSAVGSGASITTTAPPASSPSLLVVNAEAGLGVVGMGDLETTSQLSLKVGAGYPLALGPLTLEVGGAATFTTLEWENNAGDSGSSLLWSLLANARANYPMGFLDGFALTGEVGLGMLNFSGISDEAAPVFLEPGMVADGTPSMFHVRFAFGAEYSFMPNLAATLSPVFAYSPAKDGFREDIGSITRFDVLVGLAYKL